MENVNATFGHGDPNLRQKIMLPNAHGFDLVNIDQIIRLEADDNYTRVFIHGKPGIHVSKTLKYLEGQLAQPRFFRTNRSHIINIGFMTRWIRENNWLAVMEDGFSSTISRRKRQEFIAVLSEWVLVTEGMIDLPVGLMKED